MQRRKIKELLEHCDMLQGDLAERIGRSPQWLSQKMRLETLTDEQLADIANACGAEFVPFAFKIDDKVI